jgi:hypothetical protein
MDAVMKKVVLWTKKVNTCIDNVNSSLTKRNNRLVQKYTVQLQDELDCLLDACVDAELHDQINGTEAWMNEAHRVEKSGQSCLVKGNEYMLDCEKCDEAGALQKVLNAKIDELSSLLVTFEKSLVMPDVEVSQTVIGGLMDERKCRMKEFAEQKVKIVGEAGVDDQKAIKNLERVYSSAALALNKWVDSCVTLVGDSNMPMSKSTSQIKGPGLKLDRLALPILRGNVRNFARFLREFDSTVGEVFSDPKTKVLYLQNQCLSGAARELVRNLTTFDDVMSRLKERYGKVSVVIDTVLKDIEDLKLGAEEPAAVMSLSKCLEMAWDDMVAVDAIDEFCNVVVLRSLECKLPRRLQTLWAQEKGEVDFKSSKDAMIGLKSFINRHRKIAEEVLAMRGKTLGESVKPYAGKQKVEKGLVNNVDNSKPERKPGCFRCGFTNHRVRDCKVPSSIKCRACGRTGHIQNACREPPTSSSSNLNRRVQFDDSADTNPVSNCNAESSVAVRLPIETINTELGPCLALWDSGSVLNLIDSDWAYSKGLSGKVCNLEFRVVDGSAKSVNTKVYNVPLTTRNGDCKIIRAYGLDSLAASVKSLQSNTLESVLKSLNVDVELSEVNNPQGSIQLLWGIWLYV